MRRAGCEPSRRRLCRYRRVNRVDQLRRRLYRRLCAAIADNPRYLCRPVLLAPIAQYPRQLLARVTVNHVARRQRLRTIHAHVQRRVGMIRKSPRALVQLVARHAQIQQHAVYALYAHARKQFGRIVEVAAQRHKARIAAQPRTGCGNRVSVSVYAYQPSLVAQPRQYARLVPAAAQRTIHIYAFRAYRQLLHALVKQHRLVRKLHVLTSAARPRSHAVSAHSPRICQPYARRSQCAISQRISPIVTQTISAAKPAMSALIRAPTGRHAHPSRTDAHAIHCTHSAAAPVR